MTFTITGRVVDAADGRGIAGARVEAWDKDPLVDDCLDSADTGADGAFTVTFGEDAFRDAGLDRLPDVYFKVLLAGRQIASTEQSLICNLDRSPFDVTIGVERPAGEPPPVTGPVERLIEGLPRPADDHPRLILLDGGSVAAIADGRTVSAFRLLRREGTAHATLIWRHDCDGRVAHLLAWPGGGAVAIADTGDGATAVVLDQAGARALAACGGTVVSATMAAGRLIASVRRPSGEASLREFDLSSGLPVAERALASADIDLAASPSGRYVSITDRRSRTTELRTAAGAAPCPPAQPSRPDPARPPQGDDARHDPCGCRPDPGRPGGTHAPHTPGASDTPPPGHPGREPVSDPCQPADAAVPDDRGGVVVVDGGRVGHRPPRGTRETDPLGRDCWGDLPFVADKVRWAGHYIVATQGNYMRRMAVVAPDDLRVVRDRDFGAQGALVFASPDAEDLVVYHPRRGAFELLGPESIVDELDKGPAFFVPPDEKAFVGQKTLSLIPEHIPTKGDIHVLVLPVIESTQAYNEPNLSKIDTFLDGGHFKTAIDYYEENSFRQAHLHFHMFGRDRGPGPGPLVLKDPITSYFWPKFFAGGVELVRTLPAGTTTIAFDGSETMSVRATPRVAARQPIDLTLRFGAALLRAEHDAFPVKIIIAPGQTATITAVERDGTSRTLNLTFLPQTLEIKQDDVPGGLAAVASYLDAALAAAEASAAVPSGRLFAKPEVRRVATPDLDFGELHVNLAFAPRPAGPGRLAVVSVSGSFGLTDLGFSDAIVARFNPSTDAGQLQDYVTRLMRQAESANAKTALNPVLATAADVAVSGSDLKTTILLSDNDGGPDASITVTASGNTGQLFTSSSVLPGSISTKNNANSTRQLDKLLNDVFAAAMERMGGDLSPITGINAVIVGFIGGSAGAPPALAWDTVAPDGTANLREVHKSFTAEYKIGAAAIQLKSRWIVSFLSGTPDTSTLCHELGHAFGFRDLYEQTDYRDDLRYLETWALMDKEDDFPHHAGYHKWQAGWIPDARIVDVDKPLTGPTQAEALLVPVEFWDDGMEAAVRAAYPGLTLPVAQLMRMNLGGDGGMFDLVEARQSTAGFSTKLPHSPALIVTNALVPWDDKEYAQILGDEQRYRRELHLLNEGHELQAAGNEFDLGLPDELAAVGIKVRIVNRKSVMRPAGQVQVFHVKVTREQAPTIDLGFTIPQPYYYKNPDLWLDHPDPGQTTPTIWPEGEPTHQGDQIHVPPETRPDKRPEPHFVVARVHNYGAVDALKVRVDFAVCRPPGSGDRGNFVKIDTETVEKIPAGAAVPVWVTWPVEFTESGHTCLRATIVDYKVPEDAGTGIALASNDVTSANSEAIKNLDEHKALSESPYAPVPFEYSVNNEGHRARTVYLQPEGLPEGMRLTVSPPQQVVPPRSTVIFRCRLELDDKIIAANCRSDSEFTILAWRMTEETSVRWGGVQYRIRPRRKTTTTVSGGWFASDASVSGRVDPDPGGGEVRLRINFNNVKARWQALPLGAGGTFRLDLKPPAGALQLDVEAAYRGSRYFGPSRSAPLSIFPYVVK